MKKGIVVMGASGHAKVCIELLRSFGGTVECCIGSEVDADTCMGLPVLKGESHLERLRGEGYTEIFIAVVGNSAREKLASLALSQSWRLVSAISPHAVISPSARIGEGVAIMPGAIINTESQIGDLAIINTGAVIDHDCIVGTAVHIAPQGALAGNVRVGARSFLGTGCKVIPGIVIGADAMIGAGAAVVANLDDEATAVGVPARAV